VASSDVITPLIRDVTSPNDIPPLARGYLAMSVEDAAQAFRDHFQVDPVAIYRMTYPSGRVAIYIPEPE